MQILKLQKATGSNRKIIFKGTGRIKLRSQLRGNWPTPKRGFQTDAFQFFLIRNNVPYNIQFPYLIKRRGVVLVLSFSYGAFISGRRLFQYHFLKALTTISLTYMSR